ncbi:MAG TPA: hypothetical protein VGL94_08060 [Ktedonobacteraceae bacterium]|jgi:hypothetical protein
MKMIEESASLKATRGFAKILAVGIVLSVAAFSDIMYIQEMQKVFSKDPTLLLFCYLGAFTSFAAIGYLLLGKSAVFAPGGQMLASWIVFAAELIIATMNIILVFDSTHTGFLAAWAFISPATPVFHMVGVALIFFLDPELKEKHRDMELQSKLRQADRDYDHAVALARVEVKRKHLEFTMKELGTAINSSESQARISQHAHSMNDGLLTEMSGRAMPKDDDSNDRYYGRR